MSNSKPTLAPGEASPRPTMQSPHIGDGEDTDAEIRIYLERAPDKSLANSEQQHQHLQGLRRSHFSLGADDANQLLPNLPAPSPATRYSIDELADRAWAIASSRSSSPSENAGRSAFSQSFLPGEFIAGQSGFSGFPPTPNFRTSAEAHADSYARLFGEYAHEETPIAQSAALQPPSLGREYDILNFDDSALDLDQYEFTAPISPNFAPTLPQGPFVPTNHQSAPQPLTSLLSFGMPTSIHTPIAQAPTIQKFTAPHTSNPTEATAPLLHQVFPYLDRAKTYLITRYLQEFPGGATRVGHAMIRRQIQEDVDFFITLRDATAMRGLPFTDEEMVQCCETALAMAAENFRAQEERGGAF